MSLHAAALIALLVVCMPARAAGTLPPGFDDRPVTSVYRPTAIAFTPDGTMLTTSSIGQVYAYKDGQALPWALDIGDRVCFDFERGILGIAVDPSYASNRYVYLFYTFNKHGQCGSAPGVTPVNRVSRFVMRSDGTLDPGSEDILIDNIPSVDGGHNAGDLQFGPDELLYISVGDGTCDYAGDSGCQEANDAARDPNVLLGKILRIERDGSIPAGNPYQGANTARCAMTGVTEPGKWCRETWASGLRNPFRIAFDPDSEDPRMFINDVGGGAFEEINLGIAGADYGWNVREGFCVIIGWVCPPPPAGMTDPLYSYNHAEGCTAITGGAFVPDEIWPGQYGDDYLYADFTCGKILRLSPAAGGGFASTEFATGLGSYAVISMNFGPDVGHGDGPSLYYATWGEGGLTPELHEVRRISLTANRAPVARAHATPAHGSAPLDVDLNATESQDPDGDPLTYEWSFGDGSASADGMQAEHMYSDGVHTATLTVRDGQGGEDTAQVRIDSGNDPPEPRILTSMPMQGFTVGQQIHLVGLRRGCAGR